MGRPLKISKYQIENTTLVDVAYPNFGSLEAAVYPATFNTTQYYGVVGGSDATAASATNPIVQVQVNIANSYTGDAQGFILRQKGAHKFLVATRTPMDPANAVVGVAAKIVALGNTNWAAMGAPSSAAVGTIFTVTAASAGGTTGTMQEVGICVLDNDASPAAGFMSIGYSDDASSLTYISKLTNKFLLNWAGGNDYAATSVVNDERLLANFFSDEGAPIKSGTAQTTITPAIVELYT
jgi:hypothetical protein